MDTGEVSRYILDTILNEVVMAAIWMFAITYILVTAVRLRLQSLSIIAAGALPFTLFYILVMADWFPSMEAAVLYSRLANVILAFSIVASLAIMYNVVRRNRPK